MFEKMKKKAAMKSAKKAYEKALRENPRHLTYVPANYPNRRIRRAMAKLNRRK
jgi:hypothetical protein